MTKYFLALKIGRVYIIKMVAGECDSDKKCESSEFKQRNLFWQFLAVLPVKKTNKILSSDSISSTYVNYSLHFVSL